MPDPSPRPPREGRYEPEELSLPRALKLLSRGIRLRCPHCGEGRLRESWMRLRFRCPVCGLRTDRGEEDFFLGGMMWNLVFAEGSLLVAAVALGVATWPDVPWDLMQWGGIALMVAAPFLLYPFSLGFWLANDIWIRPVTEEEMAWHRASQPGEYRSQRDR